MKKVFHVITELETGGAERMLMRLVSASDRKRVSHLVVSMTGEDSLGKCIKEAGIPLFTLGMKRGRPSLGALIRFVRILKTEKPDILQTWLYHADLFGLIAGKLAGVRRIFWNIRCSDMEMTHYSHLSSWLVSVLARLSPLPGMVIVNSEAGREQHILRGYSPKSWRVIHNGFDLDEFRPEEGAKSRLCGELGLPLDSVLAGMIARYDPMKDHAGFLRAAGLAGPKYPKVHFVLAGKGVTPENGELRRGIERQNLEGRVHLLGERGDISALMPGFDFLCQSSLFGEGFSNVVGEGMACGVPCVATDVGDSAYIVGETGRIVSPGDPAALAEAMGEIAAMGEEGRRGLGKAARRRIRDLFNLPAVVAEYERIYAEG